MFIVSIAIIVTLIALSVIGKNKYKYLITLYCIIFTVMFLIADLYISKTTSFRDLTSDNTLYYMFINIFSKLTISISDISRYYNLCFAAFMTVSLFISSNFLKIRLKHFWFFIIPIILFVYLTDPTTERNIFIAENLNPKLNWLDLASTYFCVTMVHIYAIMPMVSVLICLLKSKIFAKKYHFVSILIIMTMITSYFFIVFIYGTYKCILFTNVSVAKIPNLSTTSAPLAEFLINIFMVVILWIVVSINPFKYLDYKPKIITYKNSETLNKNLNMILHTYKNAFWCIAQQIDEVKKKIDNNELEKAAQYATSSFNVAKENFDNITNMLLVINNKRMPFKILSLYDCITDALASISLPESIQLFNGFSKSDDVFLIGSKPHIVEMMINIINNAIDALSSCNKDEKFIKLNFITEDELCMLTVTDNGIGINKKNLSKIFRLFYTTKSYTTNNGIGLNYVKNVVAMHKGEIRITSKPDKYTNVHIVLPIAKNHSK